MKTPPVRSLPLVIDRSSKSPPTNPYSFHNLEKERKVENNRPSSYEEIASFPLSVCCVSLRLCKSLFPTDGWIRAARKEKKKKKKASAPDPALPSNHPLGGNKKKSFVIPSTMPWPCTLDHSPNIQNPLRTPSQKNKQARKCWQDFHKGKSICASLDAGPKALLRRE